MSTETMAEESGVLLRVEWEPTEEEFIEAAFWRWGGLWKRRVAERMALAASMFALASIFSGPWVFGAAFYVCSGIFLHEAMITWYTRDKLMKMWRDHAHYRHRIRTIFLTPGVRTETHEGRASVRWEAFTHYGETARLFLMFSGEEPLYVAKRVFGVEETEKLRAILAEKIGRTRFVPEPKGFPVEAKLRAAEGEAGGS